MVIFPNVSLLLSLVLGESWFQLFLQDLYFGHLVPILWIYICAIE